MITKLVILVLLIWLGFRIYNWMQKKSSIDSSKTIFQDMVSCDKCGIHIPANEAIKSGEKYFCSRDHLLNKD